MMHLLNTTTLKLHNYPAHPPDYVILSHTWGDAEVSFDEMQHGKRKILQKKQGYDKIVGCCAQARKDGFDWAWVDTCCIDKRSSSELSEAINSMYRWYWGAAICYAYLSDVRIDDTKDRFVESRWFTRGWTLQELLAPPVVEFYDKSWEPLGSKSENLVHIQRATLIDGAYIRNRDDIQYASIATKFSWASRRETSRMEDAAYCLLGLVQVNMPLLYGEGKRAFHRLQVELLNRRKDHSILAWHHKHDGHYAFVSGALAPDVSVFEGSSQYRISEAMSSGEINTHEVTSHGLRMTLLCRQGHTESDVLARLQCQDERNRPMVIHLCRNEEAFHYVRRQVTYLADWNDNQFMEWQPRLVYLAIDEDIGIEDEYRPTLMVFARFPASGLTLNGLTVSTLRGIHIEQRVYDEEDPTNKWVAQDQRSYLCHGILHEHQVVCLRLSSERWEPKFQAVILGLSRGRPMIHHTTDKSKVFWDDWFQELQSKPSTYLRDYFRSEGDRLVIELRAKRRRWRHGFAWVLDFAAFECTCDFSPYAPDCVCGMKEFREQCNDDHEKETGVWRRFRQKLCPAKRQSQTENEIIITHHLFEGICSECGRDGNIEVCHGDPADPKKLAWKRYWKNMIRKEKGGQEGRIIEDGMEDKGPSIVRDDGEPEKQHSRGKESDSVGWKKKR
jgi:hypothetical protein